MARLSPFKSAAKLKDDELSRLRVALVTVLRDALEASMGHAASDLKDDKRRGLHVHAAHRAALRRVWRHHS